MRPSDNIERLIQQTNYAADPAKRKQILDDASQALRQSRQEKPAFWRNPMQKLSIKAIAAAIIIAAGILMYHLTGSIDGASVAWADVVEKFGSITFFNASVYIKENATDEPVQVEIWRNSQNKARIRVDGQVLFADGGNVVAGYAIDGTLRKIDPAEYNEMGMMLAKKLFSFREFSLDTVLDAFNVSKDRLTETTPLINPAAMISQDMLVFDVQSSISPEWMRIWVLRESRLPIRIQSWDPRYGDSVEVLMSYSAEQSPEFFDPKAYEQVLLDVQQGNNSGGRANLAYALLKDPGGKDYTPKDLFEKSKIQGNSGSAYHVPEVQDIGMTEYGAVWIIAAKAENRKPDGNPFYGFSDVRDDLGRMYRRMSSFHQTRGDISGQIYVPQDYPFDKRIPKRLQLICEVETYSRYEKKETIGTVDFSEWKQNTRWPKEGFNEDEIGVMLQQASSKANNNPKPEKDNNHRQCRDILEFIRKLDTTGQYTLATDRTELKLLVNQKNFPEAMKLVLKNLEAEFDCFKKSGPNTEPSYFFDYIIAIAVGGNTERAAKLYREVRQLEPNLEGYNTRVKKHILERLRGRNYNYWVSDLFSAGLDLEQVNKIMGFDVLENQDTKWYVPETIRRQQDPRVIKQQEYTKKLTAKYKANPLKPGQMVLNKHELDEIAFSGSIPDVKDHYFYVFNNNLHSFLKGYKSTGQTGRTNHVRIEEGIENPILHNEIIFNSPDGFQSDKCREFVMSEFGLEAVQSGSEEMVLVAEYDGSERKDYQDIRCPAVRGSTSTPGTISIRSSGGITLKALLDNLARDQQMMVINNTGLDENTIMTQEVPNFKTAMGMELAEKWYKENFGITFHKEQRRLPIWIIQKKQ